MALYLVQHAKSQSKEIDPDQSLSNEGIADVKRIAGVAKGYGVHVSRIQHSGKKRARQTAEIFASELEPPCGVHQIDGISPLDDVAVFARQLRNEEDLMVVGHLPFMERLVSFLIIGSAEKTIIKFQNGGIVSMDKGPESTAWFIQWTLMPKIG